MVPAPLPPEITGAAPLFPLAVLFGLNVVDELDRTAFEVLTPEIRDAFGLERHRGASSRSPCCPWPSSSSCPSAFFADRRNRTRMAAGGAAMWAGFTLLTGIAGLAASLTMLYFARAGSALGKTFNATHNSLLADYYPQEARARVFYAHRLANSLGQFVGPLVAGILAARLRRGDAVLRPGAAHASSSCSSPCACASPIRGVHERRAAGADEATAEIEEVPAGSTRRSARCSPAQRAPHLPLAPVLRRLVPRADQPAQPLLRGGLQPRARPGAA